MTPLKVVLLKHQYEQVLQTLDNMTYSPPSNVAPEDKFNLADIEEESTAQPSTSALKLDGLPEKRKEPLADRSGSEISDAGSFSPILVHLQVQFTFVISY